MTYTATCPTLNTISELVGQMGSTHTNIDEKDLPASQ